MSEQEEAFRRADDGYTFLGKKLEPFSFLRQTALISLSLQMGATRSIEAAAAMWLMSKPDQIVREARRNPSKYIEEIDAYGEQSGLGAVTGENHQAATALLEQIIADVKAGTGKPDRGTGEDEEQGN